MLAYLFLSCSTDTAKLPKSKCVISINLDDISVEKFQTARLTKPDKLFKSGVLFLNTQNVMLSVTLPRFGRERTETHEIVRNRWKKDKRVLPPASKDGHDGITSAEMEGSFAWPDEVPGFIQIILNDKLLQAQSSSLLF